MSPTCTFCESDKTFHFIDSYRQGQYWKCKKCEFVFEYPISPVKSDMDCWVEIRDPDGRVRDLTKEREYKLKNWYGDIASVLKKEKPGRVLDLGCGLGYLLSALSDRWHKYGYEPNSFAQSFITKQFPEITLLNDCRLGVGSLDPTYIEMFDVVICYHVIEHVARPRFFFEELVKLVKPGGVLIVGTPNMGSLAARRFRGNFRLLGPGHVSMFNAKNLTQLFREQNLNIFKKEYPYFKTDYFSIKELFKLFNMLTMFPLPFMEVS